MADDKVVKIDGESTFGLSDDQCVEKPDGGAGYTLSRSRSSGRASNSNSTIEREPIKTRSVKGFHRDPTDTHRSWQSYIDPTRKIVYLRLTQFTPNCSARGRRSAAPGGCGQG
jgi:C-terminal processing protease CtpA/Prc